MKRKPPSLDNPLVRHRTVTDEEAALWRESVEGKIPAPLPKAAPSKAEKSPPPVKKKTTLPKSVSSLDAATSQRIRRGSMAIEATLDLHGYTSDIAHAVLARFIAQAQARGIRTVLVITGKGGGDTGGVLRRMLPEWINQSPLRERIIAYDSAGASHGGSGAWYIRIRRNERR